MAVSFSKSSVKRIANQIIDWNPQRRKALLQSLDTATKFAVLEALTVLRINRSKQ